MGIIIVPQTNICVTKPWISTSPSLILLLLFYNTSLSHIIVLQIQCVSMSENSLIISRSLILKWWSCFTYPRYILVIRTSSTLSIAYNWMSRLEITSSQNTGHDLLHFSIIDLDNVWTLIWSCLSVQSTCGHVNFANRLAFVLNIREAVNKRQAIQRAGELHS